MATPPKPQRKDRVSAIGRALTAPSVTQPGSSYDLAMRLTDQMSDLPGKKLIRVPLSALDPNPYNARVLYDPAIIKERSNSLKADGQDEPIRVVANQDAPGRYICIAGHYRWKAAQAAEFDALDAIEVAGPMTRKQLYEASFRENDQRAPQTAMDNAYAWKALLDEGVVASHEDIALMTGVSVGMVSKTLGALSLPQEVLAVVSERPDKFGPTVLYALQRFCASGGSLDRAIELARGVADDSVTRAQIEAERPATQSSGEQGGRKSREIPRTFQAFSGASRVGAIKEFDSGRVTLDVTFDDPAKRDQLVALLKQHLSQSQ